LHYLPLIGAELYGGKGSKVGEIRLDLIKKDLKRRGQVTLNSNKKILRIADRIHDDMGTE